MSPDKSKSSPAEGSILSLLSRAPEVVQKPVATLRKVLENNYPSCIQEGQISSFVRSLNDSACSAFALEFCEAAIEYGYTLAPDCYAVSLAQNGMLDKGLSIIDQARQAGTLDEQGAESILADVYRAAGQMEEAISRETRSSILFRQESLSTITQARQAYNENPDNPYLLEALVSFLILSSNPAFVTEAIDLSKHLIDMEPTVGYEFLASAYEEQGNFQAAITARLQGIKLESHEDFLSQNYYGLGRLYGKIGNLLKAAQSFQKALELDPTNEDARKRFEYFEAHLPKGTN